MALIENIIVLAAFLVFGLVGNIIVLMLVESVTISRDIAGYFGFAIGFMTFGFLYFKNTIDRLKKELEHCAKALKAKTYLHKELKDKMAAEHQQPPEAETDKSGNV